jgi:hypothetical protein
MLCQLSYRGTVLSAGNCSRGQNEQDATALRLSALADPTDHALLDHDLAVASARPQFCRKPSACVLLLALDILTFNLQDGIRRDAADQHSCT